MLFLRIFKGFVFSGKSVFTMLSSLVLCAVACVDNYFSNGEHGPTPIVN